MTIPVFAPTANPDPDMEVDITLRVKETQYGNGYKHVGGDGINAAMGTYPVKFTNAKYAEANYIIDFLKAQGGFTTFIWTPNGESTPLYFKCKKYSYAWKNGRYCDIKATFEQSAPI